MSNYVNILDIIYPIGSVYITFNSVSPASSITNSTTSISNPLIYSKDIYWDSRPAYITCNMYRRTA